MRHILRINNIKYILTLKHALSLKHAFLNSLIIVVLFSMISLFAAQKENYTFLGAIVHHATREKLSLEAQEIIFDYLKDSVIAIGFIELKTDTFLPHWCSYGGFEESLKNPDITPADIRTVIGLDSGLNTHYLTDISLFKMIASIKNQPHFAFNPEHFGIWFVSSDEEALLSSPVSNIHDINALEKKAIQLINRNKKKQLKAEGWDDDYDSIKLAQLEKLNQSLQTPAISSKSTWLEKLKKTLHITTAPSPKTGFDTLIIGTNGEQLPLLAQNIIFEYLQSSAFKQKTVYCTDKGLKTFYPKIAGLAQCLSISSLSNEPTFTLEGNVKNQYADFPGISIDCIEGQDQYGRKHLIVSETSTYVKCIKPDNYASIRIADNQNLVSIAKEPLVAFYSPGPEEEALKGIENERKKQKIQELVIQTKNNKLVGEIPPDLIHKKQDCVIQ